MKENIVIFVIIVTGHVALVASGHCDHLPNVQHQKLQNVVFSVNISFLVRWKEDSLSTFHFARSLHPAKVVVDKLSTTKNAKQCGQAVNIVFAQIISHRTAKA